MCACVIVYVYVRVCVFQTLCLAPLYCLLQRNAIAEIADNELDQKRLEGQEVLYGNLIQLQHAFTGKYLTINSSATSLLESTNLRVRHKEEGEGVEGEKRGGKAKRIIRWREGEEGSGGEGEGRVRR